MRWVRFALMALASAGAARPLAAQDPFQFDVRRVTDGVYVIFRPDATRRPVEGNVVLIVNDDDAVVVDNGGTPLSAQRIIAKIREITDKPVRYVINTHWHTDHISGNRTFLSAFPGIEIVAHATTYQLIERSVPDSVGSLNATLEETKARYQRWVDTGSYGGETALSEEELAYYRQTILDLDLAFEAAEQFRRALPTIVFHERFTTHSGGRRIEVLHLGPGNTDGDAVVYLPQDKVLITGDLVVHPMPYGFGSFPAEWAEVLRSMTEMDIEYVIPGHGEVMTDFSYVETLIALLSSVADQAARAVGEGLSREKAVARIDLSEHERRITGGNPLLAHLFMTRFALPIKVAAYREARARQ